MLSNNAVVPYIAEPLSRKDLRSVAKVIRDAFGSQDLEFPVIQFLEYGMQMLDTRVEIIIVEDSELPERVHGDTDIIGKQIRIKNSVYEGACEGNGRDRYTIMHEIAHYLLMCICGFRFQRNVSRKKVKTYEDPEWQADCLAGEILMSYEDIKDMSAESIEKQCKVSSAAARTQLRLINR